LVLSSFIMILFILTLLFQSAVPHEIVFMSQTRGFREVIAIKKDSIQLELNGVVQIYKLELSDWERVRTACQQVEYTKIDQYAAPTQARTRDAAKHSQISISVGEEKYNSNEFDDTKAPAELKKLMTLISQLKTKYQR
jgi:hypothetical protein